MTNAEGELRVLAVDDNPTNLQVLVQTLSAAGHRVLAAKNGRDALAVARKARPALILLDIMMPEMDGYETCAALKEDAELRSIPVIFLSALDEVGDKVRGFELGAVDYIAKPFQAEEVVARVGTHLDLAAARAELEARNEELEHELAVAREIHRETLRRCTGMLLGESPAIQALRSMIDAYAGLDTPLIVYGPSGSGDETFSRELHDRSPRRHRAFIILDCSASASSSHGSLLAPVNEDGEAGRSKIELAHGGTLFIENIHLLPPPGQEEFLGILEEAEDRRSRGQAPYPDTRVVATTRLSAGEGLLPAEFSPGLRQLLTRSVITLPGLVERRDDIEVLAGFFMKRHARRTGKQIERISPDSLARLCEYSWPRNLRELEEVIQHSVVLAQTPELHIESALLEEGIPLGSYRLVEKIGAGGMGEVWRANHKLLAHPAAIKLVRTGEGEKTLATTEGVLRFKREARATASLTSPHTVRLFDFGISEEEEFYYVMELLEGMDLDTLVKEHGAVPPERAVHFLLQACRSLGEAHAKGLVHRDIKPANLFAARLGMEVDFLKVLDFGIVSTREKDGDPALTETDAVTGTPYYMAPEAVTQGTRHLQPSGDVYSLGCVGYWLLTGRTVFEGTAPVQVLMKHATQQPEPPSLHAPGSVPKPLETILLRCLAKDPGQRPEVGQLAEALKGIRLKRPWTEERAAEWWRDLDARRKE